MDFGSDSTANTGSDYTPGIVGSDYTNTGSDYTPGIVGSDSTNAGSDFTITDMTGSDYLPGIVGSDSANFGSDYILPDTTGSVPGMITGSDYTDMATGSDYTPGIVGSDSTNMGSDYTPDMVGSDSDPTGSDNTDMATGSDYITSDYDVNFIDESTTNVNATELALGNPFKKKILAEDQMGVKIFLVAFVFSLFAGVGLWYNRLVTRKYDEYTALLVEDEV